MPEQLSVKMEDAQIIFRNFTGKEGRYNQEGDRSFCAILTPELADTMTKDGWNVRWLEPREEGDLPTPYIQVAVNFNNRPPRVVMMTETGRINLVETSIEVLDWADFEMVDFIARGYQWEVNGKSGVKAYLQSLYVTVAQDDLDRKYADVPE